MTLKKMLEDLLCVEQEVHITANGLSVDGTASDLSIVLADNVLRMLVCSLEPCRDRLSIWVEAQDDDT